MLPHATPCAAASSGRCLVLALVAALALAGSGPGPRTAQKRGARPLFDQPGRADRHRRRARAAANPRSRAWARDLDYYSEYIDRARFPDAQYKHGFRDFLRLKYKDQRFDVVIAMQDLALEFVGEQPERAVSRHAGRVLRDVSERPGASRIPPA